MKIIRMVVACACLLALSVSSPASAQTATDTLVSIPWGDWLADSASTVVMVIGAVIAWGLRLLPSRLLAVIQTAQLDQLLLKAIDNGINKTAGASKGKEMKVDVANAVLATALQYAIDNAPGWMVAWAGGELALRDKIIARLDVEAAAALK
jgi:hypothetical protein